MGLCLGGSPCSGAVLALSVSQFSTNTALEVFVVLVNRPFSGHPTSQTHTLMLGMKLGIFVTSAYLVPTLPPLVYARIAATSPVIGIGP